MSKVDYNCWDIIYAPDLGMLGLGNEGLKSRKGVPNKACQEKVTDAEIVAIRSSA